MAILLSKNIAQCDDRATTARRDDRAAVGWAWTGRNLILDEALRTVTPLDSSASSSRLRLWNDSLTDVLASFNMGLEVARAGQEYFECT